MVRRGEVRRRREQEKVDPTKKVKPVAKKEYKFFVDCNIPVKDGILDLDHFVSLFILY